VATHTENNSFLENVVTIGLTVAAFIPLVGDLAKGAKGLRYADEAVDLIKPFTKSSLSLGQEMHRAYKSDLIDGIAKFKEFRLPSGKRIDYTTKSIFELKPYNPTQIRKGIKQLEGYLMEVEEFFGEGWKSFLDTY